MDTKKDSRIPQCGILPEIDKNKVIVGAKQLRKAMEKGTVKCVCLAKNADPAITSPIEARCLEAGISIAWVCTMQELGSACGIECGAAAAAAVD